jgi:beta-glucanase (GH16 family)
VISGFGARLRAGFVTALLAVPVAGCIGITDPEPKTWQLAWQDEFDGPAGRLPDPTKWRFDIGTDWGNAQLEYDTDRPENVSLDGEGHLAITARQEAYRNRSYTSGRITTRGLFEQKEGRFEARIKLPTGQGIWPAFWMLGNDFETVGWPECGEIDIMEYRGQEPDRVFGTIHGPGYSGVSGVGDTFELIEGRFDTAFHTFAVEWNPGSIRWLIDNRSWYRITSDQLLAKWVFDHPFYMLLNVAVGGGFVGPPDASTTFPQTMLVDWVRVYRLVP